MMNDPIADMITRIRNNNRIGVVDVSMPSSKIKVLIAEALKREGYLSDVEVDSSTKFPTLNVRIKRGPNGQETFGKIERISSPGCRVYRAIEDVKKIRAGLGNTIMSTSKGVLSDREAREKHVGGELLFSIV